MLASDLAARVHGGVLALVDSRAGPLLDDLVGGGVARNLGAERHFLTRRGTRRKCDTWATDDAFTAKKAGGSVFFGSSDAGVVRWDKPLPFPTPLHAQPDLSVGQSWMLWNNIWNTVSL